MNRINKLFNSKQNNILSVYFTGGYPKYDDTPNVIRELQAAGVDLIEVGIPFSDPMADGPVIQASNNIALKNGMTLKKLIAQLKGIRSDVTIPLILMGYLNPIMQYGFEQFCIDCKEAELDGVIIPDLPFDDYIKEYKSIADKHDIKVIMLITPETSDERIRLIDENTDGFIYMVSSASVTGAQSHFNDDKQAYFKRINSMQLRSPRLVGFGISNKDTLQSVNENANGAIIGSKFIQCLVDTPDIKSAVNKLMTDLKE